jgi:septal ring factor EnvC (AmiA/AmiB activator)
MARVLSLFKAIFKGVNLLIRPCHLSLRLLLILFLVASTLANLPPSALHGAQPVEVGIVVANYLNLRPEPGLDKPPLKTLRSGDKVKIDGYSGGWVKVTHGSHTGYIRNRKQYIRIIGAVGDLKKNDSSSDMDIERIKREAEDITFQIEKSEQEIVAYTEQETAVIESLHELEAVLDRTAKHIVRLKPEIENLEKKIAETNIAAEHLASRIKVNEAYAAKRLIALYKLNNLGRIHVLTPSESVYDIFLRKASLGRILTYDQDIRNNLLKSKAGLTNLHARLTQQKTEKRSLETALEKQMDVMAQKSTRRSKLLDEIREKKSLEVAAIDSLKQAAVRLDQTIKSLSEKLSRTRSTARSKVENKSSDLKRDLSGKKFADLKGLLNMPVKGRIIKRFGPHKVKKFNVVNFRSGIDIQAERGEPIHAVSAGHVLYAEWFKGYGNMIIIGHGDSYYTLYAHAEELFKKEGDFVENNEVIATVGDSGSMVGPALYFEVRYRGKPMDPLEWIHRG